MSIAREKTLPPRPLAGARADDGHSALALWSWRAGALLLSALVALLALYELTGVPRLWFDEGSYLHVPKNLALHGVYADSSSEGLRYFGPVVGIGPTVMLPLALVFKTFGVGLLQARLFSTVWLALALLCFYRVGARALSRGQALLAVLLLVSAPAADFIMMGRQMLGEVPAFTFLLGGLWLWHASYERRHLPGLALAGLCFGLTMVTKNQFALVVMPALGLFTLLDWRLYRRGCWTRRLLPIVVALGCYGLWFVAQMALLGPSTMADNMAQTRQATGASLLVFDAEAHVRAIKALLTPRLYGGLLLPALAYGAWRARRRESNLLEVLALLMCGLVAIWFALFSIGWPRYAFAATSLGAIFVARMLVDAYAWAAARRPRLAHAASALVAAGLLASLGVTAAPLLRPDRTPATFAQYIDQHVPDGVVVETWEPELGFLSDQPFHYPPNILLDQAVRARWLHGPPISYDGLADRPAYLAIGPFGTWTQLYGQAAVERDYVQEYSVGAYTLYRRR